MNTFNERSYRATKRALLEDLTATVDELKRNSQIRRQALRAVEPPIASAVQPAPLAPPRVVAAPTTHTPPQPATNGYRWSSAGGWTRQGSDVYESRRAAALTSLQRMVPVAPDGARVDSVKLSERAQALMSERGQKIDPKDKDYLPNYRAALQEVSA
jgi:hypothetical protein